MKVCLVGHFSDNLDEGVRNVGKSIAKELRLKGIDVLTIDAGSVKNLKVIHDFKPQVLHFILSPTKYGILLAKLYSLLFFRSKVIISAVHPDVQASPLMKLLSPDLVLVQSHASDAAFRSIGYKTEFLYNGVNLNKFQPVTPAEKSRLRQKYGIPPGKFVLLHLASLKKERNLSVLTSIQNEENHVLVVGREKDNSDAEVIAELQNAGCTVWVKHFDTIEDLYNLSDCYIFPTVNKKACIETPLSVTEAMACNLPVITTRFGALPGMFSDVPGLYYAENSEEILKAIQIIKKDPEAYTRENVAGYSWERITSQLCTIYEMIGKSR